MLLIYHGRLVITLTFVIDISYLRQLHFQNMGISAVEKGVIQMSLNTFPMTFSTDSNCSNLGFELAIHKPRFANRLYLVTDHFKQFFVKFANQNLR